MDLFDWAQPSQPRPAAPASPPRLDPATLLPSRPVDWERLLAQAPGAPIRLLAGEHWTGVCVETLSAPGLGRRWLHEDGTIHEFPTDSSHQRVVFLTAEQLAPIAERVRVIPSGMPGTKVTMYEFGDPR